MTRWLVTGAAGFVGRHFVRRALAGGAGVRAAVRADRAVFDPGVEVCAVGEIGPATDWSLALAGVDTVIHLAARAHADPAVDEPRRYAEVNAAGTRRLVEAAAGAGVRRFVFVSSIAVYGHASAQRPLTEDTATAPQSPYARSKLEAEACLWDASARSGLEVVVIRPPLVYGPGAPGNFRRLLGLIDRGLPLPVGSVRNSRSMIGVTNLADLLATAATHAAAANRVFVAADGEDLSTADLMRRLAGHMQRPFRAWPFPPPMLRALAWSAGRVDTYDRLFGSLTVDASRARTLLGWRPPATLDEGLAASASWHVEQAEGRARRRSS